MNESRGAITSRVEELGKSLTRILENLDRLEGELGTTRTELRNRVESVESLLASGELVAAAGPEPAATVILRANQAIQKLSQGRTQEQILDLYLHETETYANRAILFLLKDGEYTPWKSLGFGAAAIAALELGGAEDPVLRAAEQKRLIYRTEALDQAFPWLRNSGSLPGAAVCIPFVFDHTVPLVFYGDSTEEIALDSLELLSHLAVLLLKNNYLQLLLEERAQQPPAVEKELSVTKPAATVPGAAAVSEFEIETELPREEAEPVPSGILEHLESTPEIELGPPAPEPAAPPRPPDELLEVSREPFAAPSFLDEADEAIEEPPPGEIQLEQPLLEIDRTPVEEAEPRPDFLSEMSATEAAGAAAEFAGAEVPATEAPEAAADLGAFTEDLQTPSGVFSGELEVEVPAEPSAPPAVEPKPEAPAVPAPELEKYHNEARRFARLLVSEIKLYNQDEVEEGRGSADLYERLHGDIERSREMYEKRAHAAVRSATDYFHDELVRILARGEERLLGTNYPGPVLRKPSVG